MKEIGDKLKALRESKGLSQVEFAIRCGLNPSVYPVWEQGRQTPNIKFLLKIKRWYLVEWDDILPK